MNKILFLLFAVGASSVTYSQPKYDAASIPEKLKEGAHVVKRFEEIKFEVSDIDNAHLKVHQVFTVLDKEGGESVGFHEYETRYSKLKDVEITGYNMLGPANKPVQKKRSYKKSLS